MHEAYAFLLAVHHDVLARLASWRGGIILIFGTFLAGYGANEVLGDFARHEDRIDDLEAWVVFHDDSVTVPERGNIRRVEGTLQVVQSRQDVVFRRLDGIETLMWCEFYSVRPCPEPAPSPPVRR